MGGMCTLSSTNPQNEKSVGVRLGDLCGHGMPQPRPIHLSENAVAQEVACMLMVRTLDFYPQLTRPVAKEDFI
jgi:hypothetical protein